jgi:hypothetical protein
MQCEQEVVHALEQVCVVYCVCAWCMCERGRVQYVLGSGLTKALWRDAVRAGGGARPRAGVCVMCVVCVCLCVVLCACVFHVCERKGECSTC